MRTLAVVSLLLFGCGPRYETLADGCLEWADIVCGKLQGCGTLTWPSVAACRGDLTTACCSKTDCGMPVGHCETGRHCCDDTLCNRMRISTTAISACSDGFRAESCGTTTAGFTPNACL